MFVFFFKQKTAYEMRISDWSSDVCSSDLRRVDLWLWLAGLSRRPDVLGRPGRHRQDRRGAGKARLRGGTAAEGKGGGEERVLTPLRPPLQGRADRKSVV